MPGAKLKPHVCGQLIPAGLLVTVPDALPGRVTVNKGATLKVAVTVRLVLSVTMQVKLVPLHAPPHPTKIEPVAGAAVSVTGVPVVKLALHAVGQLIPDGTLMTVPAPVPWRITVKTGSL